MRTVLHSVFPIALSACALDPAASSDEGDAGAWDASAKAAYTVCKTGGTYTTIQAAVNAVASGSTITICDGLYKERVVISGKTLSLVGSGTGGAVIDAVKSGTPLTVSGGADVTVSGVKVYRAGKSGISCTDSAVTVTSSTFDLNKGSNGAAIYGLRCDVDVSGSTFTSGKSYSYGGAVYVESSTASITGSTFTGNNAASRGGAVAGKTSTVTLDGDSFTSNTAANGGAVWFDVGIDIDNSEFTSNSATYSGGAVYFKGGAGTIDGCTFVDNSGGDDGGAVFSDVSTVALTGNYFEGNSSLDDAGAFRSKAGMPTVIDNTFYANTAVGDGGAIKMSHQYGTFSGNTFLENVAGAYGGALTMDEDTSTVTDCWFEGNRAYAGGGVWQYLGWRWADISDSTFVDNVATGYGGGFATYMASYGVQLTRVTFDGNSAPSGAGLYAGSGKLAFDGVVFVNGSATSAGGAVYLATVDADLANWVAYGNSAPSGAALYASGVTGTGVTSAIFQHNTGSAGVRLASGTLGWTYSDAYDQSSGNFSGMSDPVGTNGNVSVNAAFVDAAGGDFRLAVGSPVIDAGDPTATDRDGTRADMGAYGGSQGME